MKAKCLCSIGSEMTPLPQSLRRRISKLSNRAVDTATATSLMPCCTTFAPPALDLAIWSNSVESSCKIEDTTTADATRQQIKCSHSPMARRVMTSPASERMSKVAATKSERALIRAILMSTWGFLPAVFDRYGPFFRVLVPVS